LTFSKGNAIFTIFQKYLTGHPKGAAAAWMANGLVQTLLTGIVPGNKNADNVDPKLKNFDHLVYSSKPIHTTGIKAGVLKSFGFGQASAEILIIHPDYLFGVLDGEKFSQYAKIRKIREEKMYRFQLDVFAGKKKLVNVKEHPPYSSENEADVYLDPKVKKFKLKIIVF
jgi:fatty acid synthase subunit alpha